jgi:hypothetical protein
VCGAVGARATDASLGAHVLGTGGRVLCIVTLYTGGHGSVVNECALDIIVNEHLREFCMSDQKEGSTTYAHRCCVEREKQHMYGE